jgi:hypothetical protein
MGLFDKPDVSYASSVEKVLECFKKLGFSFDDIETVDLSKVMDSVKTLLKEFRCHLKYVEKNSPAQNHLQLAARILDTCVHLSKTTDDTNKKALVKGILMDVNSLVDMVPGEPEPAPVVEQPAPVVEQPAPVVEPEPAPVVEPEPSPVVEPEPAPVVEPEPAPVVEPIAKTIPFKKNKMKK